LINGFFQCFTNVFIVSFFLRNIDSKLRTERN
jgi:hypothetical protein